jgi:8-oxo-dGDP phosphatase
VSLRPGTQVSDTPEQWPVDTSTTHFSGGVVTVRTDRVHMPDGHLVDRDVVAHPGAVGVLALDDANRALVVHQYRHPVGQLLWEPPAGLLDVAGEHPWETARRELYEEGHHTADDWRVLVDLYTSPGMCDEAVRIYLARGLTPVDHEDRHVGVHEEAVMDVSWVPLSELVGAVLAGRLHNPTMVAGALAAHAAMNGGGGLDALRPADAEWPARGV